MESRNRTLWVVILIFGALLVACCCLAAALAAATGLVVLPAGERGERGVIERAEQVPVESAQFEQIVAVGDEPAIEIVNFAGNVDVVTGPPGEVHVRATRDAPGAPRLSDVQVLISEESGVLRIVTRRPAALMSAQVRIELAVPEHARLVVDLGAGDVSVAGVRGGVDVETGAGTVAVQALAGGVDLFTGSGQISARDVSGSLEVETGAGTIVIEAVDGAVDAHTGTGTITVQGAAGPIRLDSGAGTLEYEGAPEGECRFTTGMGAIVLRLPAGLNAQVDLSTGMGEVSVDRPVDGDISRNEVRGSVGTGQGASIYAETGNGDVSVQTY